MKQSAINKFIESVIAEHGSITRSWLMAAFGCGPACATRWLALYREKYPGSIVFDTKKKLYVKVHKKFPALGKTKPSDFFQAAVIFLDFNVGFRTVEVIDFKSN